MFIEIKIIVLPQIVLPYFFQKIKVSHIKSGSLLFDEPLALSRNLILQAKKGQNNCFTFETKEYCRQVYCIDLGSMLLRTSGTIKKLDL